MWAAFTLGFGLFIGMAAGALLVYRKGEMYRDLGDVALWCICAGAIPFVIVGSLLDRGRLKMKKARSLGPAWFWEVPPGVEPGNDGFAVRCLTSLATAPRSYLFHCR